MRNEEIMNEIWKNIMNDATQDQKGKYSIFSFGKWFLALHLYACLI